MKKTLGDLTADALAGTVVALRADLNVPLSDGKVADATRIERTVPTLRHLTEARAKVVVLSHLGRPGGRVRPELTLEPVARCVGRMVGAEVRFCAHTRGPRVHEAVSDLQPGMVAVLENTRFDPGETANDASLARDWAAWADHFVLDAFGTSHRAHASTAGLPRAVRMNGGEAVAGFLVARELAALGGALEEPRRPFLAVIGGAKISGKIDVIDALLPRVDALLVGGAMANTFFLAMGMETGASLVEPEKAGVARRLMEVAGARLVLPVDCAVAASIDPRAEVRFVDRGDIAPEEVIGDIGPVTVEMFRSRLREAATVVWNGPMGVCELASLAEGTRGVAHAAAEAADGGATVIVGGGDSAAAVRATGVAARISHVSTGGGASLALLAGRELPGLDALCDLHPREQG